MGNEITRECVDYCPTGTAVYDNNKCVETCLNGFYQDKRGVDVILATGETDQECLLCGDTCAKCLKEKECTECVTGKYLHENSGVCASKCEDGFTLVDDDQAFCREDDDKGEVEADELPLLQVTVTDNQNACNTEALAFEASGDNDLILEATVPDFKDKINTYKWEIKTSLRYDSEAIKASLLKGIKVDQNKLIIPAANIRALQTTDLSSILSYQFSVSLQSGAMSGVKNFNINIGPKMQKGVFAVIPSSGVSGQTEFTIKVSDWEVLGLENVISYSIFFYMEEKQY